MTLGPRWLPPSLTLSGTWDNILSTLYAIFQKDFKQGKPMFQGYPVWWDNRVLLDQNYEEGFWHLITRDDQVSGERLPDFRRAERLPWCAAVINNWEDSEISVWDYKENHGRTHTYLWLENHDYCIILEKLKRHNQNSMMLVTAFHVDGPSQRRSLSIKREKRTP